MKARFVLMSVSGVMLTLGLFLPAATVLATGTTRYVSTTGTDASTYQCSSAHPCKTIAYAEQTIAVSGDTISVAAGTYNEHVNVFKNVTIVGAGAGKTIVDGGAAGTVFDITTHATATIQSLKIRNGKAGTATSGQGGGVMVSGGCTLTMTGVKIVGNTANSGGGISNYGTLTLTKVTISGNKGKHNTGGGLANNGSATINQTNIFNNDSPTGGAIYNPGTLVVSSSSIHGNTSASGSPGVFNRGSATFTNTTFSGNKNTSAGAFLGAAIDQEAGSSTLNYVTISANVDWGDGAIYASGGTVTTSNSIIYGNGANPQCGKSGTATFTDGGYNVVADSSCGLTSGTGSRIANPQLKSLANYGGFSPTQALKSTSPAINLVPLARCVAKDQRGVSRPQGTKCDAGAYEYP